MVVVSPERRVTLQPRDVSQQTRKPHHTPNLGSEPRLSRTSSTYLSMGFPALEITRWALLRLALLCASCLLLETGAAGRLRVGNAVHTHARTHARILVRGATIDFGATALRDVTLRPNPGTPKTFSKHVFNGITHTPCARCVAGPSLVLHSRSRSARGRRVHVPQGTSSTTGSAQCQLQDGSILSRALPEA
jgi:hypothetical protein